MPFSGLLPPWLAQEKAGAGDQVTQRVRPGLERGASVYHHQRGPWSSSHLIQSVLLSPFSDCSWRSMVGGSRLAGCQKWSWVDRVGVKEGPPGPGAPR